MKQRISLLLVLALLFGLFAGCAQQSGEAQSGAEPQGSQTPIQPEEKAPPRTPEDFLSQLNDALKAQDIPVAFVRESDVEGYDGVTYCWYNPMFTDTNALASEKFSLCIVPEAEDGVMLVQFYLDKDATDQDRELQQKISTIAAVLCDPQMTEEQVAALFATEPSDTEYVRYTGDIGSFTKTEVTYTPISDDPEDGFRIDDGVYSVVFCQPVDLAHYIIKFPVYQYEYYQIAFTQADEKPFAQRHLSAPSVAEIEQRINDTFAARGIPVTCMLAPCEDYGRWRAVLRYTTLDDPDYTYPEFPYEEWGYQPEEVSDEFMMSYRSSALDWVYLYVYAVDAVKKDAPISYIQLQNYDEIPELAEILCIACDPEAGAADWSAIQELEPVECSDWSEPTWKRILQKDTYSITQYVEPYDEQEGEDSRLNIVYEAENAWIVAEPSGEALLDPALLDYPFALTEPMVVDGQFNIYMSGGQTLFHGEMSWLQDLINDYLMYTRTELSVEFYYDTYGEHYAIRYWGEPLSTSAYVIDQYGVAMEVYYNVNIQDYVPRDDMEPPKPEHILYVPIGISLILDESMTVEQAIALHSHAIEYDFISTEEHMNILPVGYPITVYATEDVVHILIEDTESGANAYYAITRAYVESNSDYALLLPYLED